MNFAKLNALMVGVGLVSAHVSGVYATKTRVMAEQKEQSPEEEMFVTESHNIYEEKNRSLGLKWNVRSTEEIDERKVEVLCMKEVNGGSIIAMAIISADTNEYFKNKKLYDPNLNDLRDYLTKKIRMLVVIKELNPTNIDDSEEIEGNEIGVDGTQIGINENGIESLVDHIIQNIGIDNPDSKYVRVVEIDQDQ
jgi:hypothetical protein